MNRDEFARRINSPAVVAALTLLAFAPFVVIRVVRSECDLSRFVCAGSNYCDSTATPAGLFVGENSDGYDGQFFYRLALDPFTSRRTDFGIRLDKPAYRQARIVYPLLAWSLSLGRAEWVPFWLLALNVAGLGAIGWLAGLFAQSIGRHAAWGLLISLYPGFLLTLSRDMSEILSSCALLAAMIAVQRQRILACAIALCIAALVRETTLGLAVAVLLVAAWSALFRRDAHAVNTRQALARLLCGVLPLILFGGWQLVLAKNWGFLPLHESGDNLSRPFDGLLLFLQRAFIPFRGEARLMAVQVVLLGVIGVLAIVRLGDNRVSAAIRTACVLYAGLLVSLSSAIWSEDWAYMRAASEYYVVSAAIVIGAPLGRAAPGMALAAASCAWTAQFHRDG